METYLSGKKLYGDDFSLDEIAEWYRDEQEGYAKCGAKNKETYKYAYHALNLLHGFKYLPGKSFRNVLGFGSAYGDEFLPIINRIEQLTILDPSEEFVSEKVHGVPCKYLKPRFDGIIPFDKGTFDLITCLGVLHHIANVSTVVKELNRCLSNDGIVLLREPIESMGNWSLPRLGLTKRERGIPLDIFSLIIKNAGFKVIQKSFCVFPPIPLICNRIGVVAYNSNFVSWLDAKLNGLFSRNVRYHPTRFIHKFRPACVYFILGKK